MNRATDLLANGHLDEQALARQIQALIARLRPEVTVERRHDDRVAVPLLFRLTQLNSDRQPIHDDAITVVGKDISRRGLSFFHEQPLTYRRAIVSLDDPDFGRFAAEIDVNWCRFTRPGWYESGGRLRRSTGGTPANSRPDTATGTNWLAPRRTADTCCRRTQLSHRVTVLPVVMAGSPPMGTTI
jgi:hypothetical protein